MMMNAGFIYPENTPTTKEGYYYRTIFEKFFPKVTYLSPHLLQYQLTELDHCLFTQVCSKLLFYGQNSARSTVPGGPSVACSTAKAVEWDAEWSKNPDPSGRAALGIHAAAYEESKDVKTGSLVSDSPQKLVEGVAGKVAGVV